MAISDIPEYVEVAAGDLIRADHWNNVQRQTRNGLRTHRHTHVVTAPRNDAATSDEADQISTAEIADGAVTAAKLASGAVTGDSLPDGAVTTAKIANNAVTGVKLAGNSVGTTQLQNNAVTSAKLSFQTIATNSLTLGPNGVVETPVQLSAPSTKTTVYFPTLAIVGSSGTGISNVEASIVYRQAVGSSNIDVHLRLTNRGAATASIIWQVLTFAS
ncbi:MAG TPA: hypothetical protein VLK82_09555 [Candidatus Tectomicrobia bacterium]|nr:hypothetical protein [Candidatus Tectomicrobia bacterium]